MGKLGSWGIESELEAPAVFVRPASICPSFTPTASWPESPGPCFKEERGSLFPCAPPERLFPWRLPRAGSPGHSSRLPRVSERGPDRGSTPSGGGFPSCAPLAECCSVRGHACSSRSLQGVGIPSSPNYNLSEGRDCVLLFISSCPQRMVVYIWCLIHTSVGPID